MIYGNTTENFTLLASCDSVYLMNYSKGLVASSALAGNNLHIHVTNPNESDLKYLEYLKAGFKSLNNTEVMTTSYDTLPIAHLDPTQKIVFYSSNRFIVAPEIARGDLLIIDIDSLIMNHIENIEQDIGLFFRTGPVIHKGVPYWGKKAKRVMAGSVFCKFKNIEFLKDVKNFINQNEMIWHVDQVALLLTYKHYKKILSCALLKRYHLDWHFSDDTLIWSGKNKAKDNNKTFIRKYNEFANKITITEEVI